MANLPLPTSKTIQLRDARVLGYAEYGAPDGKALFYFHGHPGSRYEARFLEREAMQAGVRLIGIDRPGLGLSTYKAGRRLLDWPGDVCELADRLDIERFAVAGFSGGGPYALACAYKIPQRLTACGVIAGVGRLSLLLANLSQWLPWILLPMTKRYFRDEEQARQSLIRFGEKWAAPDQESLQQVGVRELMAASLVEALRPGTRGAAYDGALLGRSWGFKLEEIDFPEIDLWHGGFDQEVPISVGQVVAGGLKQYRATFYPEDGHISLIVNHAAEIITALKR